MAVSERFAVAHLGRRAALRLECWGGRRIPELTKGRSGHTQRLADGAPETATGRPIPARCPQLRRIGVWIGSDGAAGRASRVTLFLYSAGTLSISDDGRVTADSTAGGTGRRLTASGGRAAGRSAGHLRKSPAGPKPELRTEFGNRLTRRSLSSQPGRCPSNEPGIGKIPAFANDQNEGHRRTGRFPRL